MRNYLDLLKTIMDTGAKRTDRTGTGTRSIFGAQLRWDLNEGFPAITTKKLAWRAVVSELLWFLEGSGDERRLCEILHGTRDSSKTTIWTANSQADYWVDNAAFTGDLGPVYGNQWRHMPGDPENYVKVRPKTPEPGMVPDMHYISIPDPHPPGCSVRELELWKDMMIRAKKRGIPVSYEWMDPLKFCHSIRSVPGYYQWVAKPKMVLSPYYYGPNSTQYSKTCAMFMKTNHHNDHKAYCETMSESHDGMYRRELYVDQIQKLIYGINMDPYGRRHIITAWNPSQIHKMALPPCHVMAQFYVNDGKLSCQLYQRSVDVGLGLPFNIASYSLLTHMIAQICYLRVGEFIHTSGDAHIYENHMPALETQLERAPLPPPTLTMPQFGSLDQLLKTGVDDYVLNDYSPHSPIQMIMAV